MFGKFMKMFFPMFVSEPERARDKKGRLVGDDKETPTINEAWVGGQAPAPKKRGRPKGSKTKTKRSKK